MNYCFSGRVAKIVVIVVGTWLGARVETIEIETFHVGFVRSSTFFDTLSGTDACINKIIKFNAVVL